MRAISPPPRTRPSRRALTPTPERARRGAARWSLGSDTYFLGTPALADRREVRATAGLVLSVGPEDRGSHLACICGELASRVALIADHGHQPVAASASQQLQRNITLVAFRGRDRDGSRCPIGCGQQVQPEAPEVPAMAGAPSIVRGIPQRRALHRLTAPGALHWRGIHAQQVVIEPGLWLANTLISHSSVSPSLRRRLKYPACPGISGNRCGRCLRATARKHTAVESTI
jgi:hypothetical protein